MPGLAVCTSEIGSFGLEAEEVAEELAVSITSPLDTPIADIGADIVFRSLGPKPELGCSTSVGNRLCCNQVRLDGCPHTSL
jgi:hypothetical protein